jgi:Xaa-Pro aminopeptidase
MIRHDKRVLGQASTLYEPGVDFERLRRERWEKVQREMATRDIGALVLTDQNNIRYTTGLSVMPIWTSYNLAHYVVVPAEGKPTIFEFILAAHRAKPFFEDVRPPQYWQARFAGKEAEQFSLGWASEIKDLLKEWGVADGKIGIDILDFNGFDALQKQGLTLTDADESLEAARAIKTLDELELLRQSAAVCETALYEMEQAIRPGISENELMGVYWHRLLDLGGEYMSTRLLVSGSKTNPWFHEAGSKLVRPGDLVAIDCDSIGPEGYLCDISRTFLCGEQGTREQKEAYQIAHDYVHAVAEELKVGVSFQEFAERVPKPPVGYRELWMPAILHGIGTDNVPPIVPTPGYGEENNWFAMPEGEFEENMVVSIEAYAGKVGAQEGVKLEDEVWISVDGPVMISLYPYEDKLLT